MLSYPHLIQDIKVKLINEIINTLKKEGPCKIGFEFIFTRVHLRRDPEYNSEYITTFLIESITETEVLTKILVRSNRIWLGRKWVESAQSYRLFYKDLDISTLHQIWQYLNQKLWDTQGYFMFDPKERA